MNRSAARVFLDQASQFQLGSLPTEARHPLTLRLSELAQTDVKAALRVLQRVELEALQVLRRHQPDLEKISREIQTTLKAGGRVFFCGCGATGRLSLAIEAIWREQTADDGSKRDKVFSFIAGGDYALIRSIENFEDHSDYGARQLRDSGFGEGDLLVATTEGGETPFVIGAAEEAVRLSSRQAVFLYCNPKVLLCQTAERSKRIIENPQVSAFSFEIGPMALAGSTRLQASSVLMLAAGSALFSSLNNATAMEQVEAYIRFFEKTDVTNLKSFIEAEANTYARKELCVHRTDRYGITVVTDTTERTPTFSLLPFEASSTERPSWTYLCLDGSANVEDAWQKLLLRQPRPVNWPELMEKYGTQAIHRFDFSRDVISKRKTKAPVHVFDIVSQSEQIVFRFKGLEASFEKPPTLLTEHLYLKALLNFSSTLVMGRLGRFASNLMLYVRPTNKKLIDRSIRFVQALLEDAGHRDVSYEAICENLFEILPNVQPDEPVVLMTYNKIRSALERSA